MTNKKAAQVIFENLAYDDNGEPRETEITEALLLAIHALIELAQDDHR